MQSKLRSPEFLQQLGQLVVDFGFMESAIHMVLFVLARDMQMVHALVPSGNSVSQNLEILRRVVLYKVQGVSVEHWLNTIDDLRSLFEERNKIFHGSFYEDDQKLLLTRMKKGKGNRADEPVDIEIDVNNIQALHSKLNSRRRQLMDFFQDFRVSETGPHRPASQELYPSLSFGRNEPPNEVDGASKRNQSA